MEAHRDYLLNTIRWHVPAGVDVSWLLGQEGPRLEQWQAERCATLIKHAPHRDVWRIQLPQGDVHLKHYRGDGREWFRRWFRPVKARGEFDITREIARRGVATLEALAVGVRPGGLDSFLVTRTLPDAVPLLDYLLTTFAELPQAKQTRFRHALAQVLGRFLHQLHGAGVTHHDLHPGNLLLRLRGDEPQLYLIDLHAVRLGGPLSWPARRANLIMLDRWFAVRASRHDRLRAWKAYLGNSGKPMARSLARETDASNLSFWREEDARCLGGNRHFRHIHFHGSRGHAVADIHRADLEALMKAPDAPLTAPGVCVLKHSRSSTVIEMDLRVGDQVKRVIYKRFSLTHWSDSWTALVRATPALRSYRHGHALRLRGIPTPRPLAVWHRVKNGLPHEGYLICDKIPEARHLHQVLDDVQVSPVRLRGLIGDTARLVRNLHQRGLVHRDLKAPNLLVSPQDWTWGQRGLAEHPGQERVWLIDLVGVRHCREPGKGIRVRDLARLNASFHARATVTRTDRLRFLRAYLGFGSGDWKSWWNSIAQATARKVAKNLHSGRPLA